MKMRKILPITLAFSPPAILFPSCYILDELACYAKKYLKLLSVTSANGVPLQNGKYNDFWSGKH